MPHITAVIDNRGPIITTNIGVSAQRSTELIKAGLSVPQHTACSLLIDTGASITCIDSTVINALGVTPTGNTVIKTPSTGNASHTANTYDISMVVLGGGIPKIISALQVVECNFGSQHLHGLLGRDVLAFSRLIYSGCDNLVMLSIL